MVRALSFLLLAFAGSAGAQGGPCAFGCGTGAAGLVLASSGPPGRPADLLLPNHPDTRPLPRPGWFAWSGRLAPDPLPAWALALACEGRAAPAACRTLVTGMDRGAPGYPVPMTCTRDGAMARCIAEAAVLSEGVELRFRLEGGGTVRLEEGAEVLLDRAPAAPDGPGCWQGESGRFCARRAG